MGRRTIARAQVEVGYTEDRYRTGEVCIRTQYDYRGGGSVFGEGRRVVCNEEMVVGFWDALLDEVLMAKERAPRLEVVLGAEAAPEEVRAKLAVVLGIVVHETKLGECLGLRTED